MKSAPLPITLVSIEKDPDKAKVKSAKAKRWKIRMNTLHQVVPMFFLIQFVMVLVALVTAMLCADPGYSLPTRKSSRPVMTRLSTGTHKSA
jgi:hypothetical protein